MELIVSTPELTPLSLDELAAEAATALPTKEVISLLDLNVDLDLGLDLAAPIDLAVAANANVAAPIDAAVGANILSTGSTAAALSDQGVLIDQTISGHAIATAPQDSAIDQSNDVIDDGTTDPGTADPGTTDPGTGGTTDGDVTVPTDPASMLDGDLLNVDVNVALDADLAAPVAGAVAANANVAAPIDAAVSANVASVDSSATAISQQDAIITQHLDDVTARATADQQAEITQ
ncbi:peptidoglycan-binding protein [Micromonospora terminaliae]|uniref:Peptidoglycan-binding protein n=1 Tax=Micromonospora terminaliae TaxID=1914461 RepID=A0AAJ2ZLE6_9ACTN|nr:peptidoglycan-binding protein [Micromonospora terminaliae]QGL51549.1 peptidoglycan-binding protein [Micromonospora terminaliae]